MLRHQNWKLDYNRSRRASARRLALFDAKKPRIYAEGLYTFPLIVLHLHKVTSALKAIVEVLLLFYFRRLFTNQYIGRQIRNYHEVAATRMPASYQVSCTLI